MKAEAEQAERNRIEHLHNERYSRISRYIDFIPNVDEIKWGEITEADFIKIGTKAKADKDAHDKEQARIKAENERLQKEKEEAEAKAQAEQKRIQDEANAKLKAEQDARLKAEQLAQAESNRLKAEADAKLKAEQAEKQKAIDEANALKQAEQARIDAKAKEEADKLAEAERIAQQGENERLLAWVESFELPTLPGGKYNKKSNATISDVSAKFESFKSWAKTQIK